MIRKLFAFAITALMLAAVLSVAAGEEEVPSTPTDLACAHEHTKATIYFFDSPAYTPVDEESHRVSGPATVETVCLDCGETLSSETVKNAEEIRSHSMKNGTCALCGYTPENRTRAAKPAGKSSGKKGERTVYARKDTRVENLQTLTLSNEELAALKSSGASTLLVRGNGGSAAIALRVEDVLAQIEADNADLYLELAERDDDTFFAGLYLITAAGERKELTGEGVTLRFYQENRSGLRASVAPSESNTLMETRIEWDGDGYWSIQYLEEGTYFILQ